MEKQLYGEQDLHVLPSILLKMVRMKKERMQRTLSIWILTSH